jgi:hypothetical protein
VLVQPLSRPDSDERSRAEEGSRDVHAAQLTEPAERAESPSDARQDEPQNEPQGEPRGEIKHRRWRKPRRHRLVWWIGSIVCALVLLFGIVVGVMLFLARDPASPYRVGQALEQFRLLQRRDDVVSSPRTRGLPVSGVYTYATRGSESASAPGLLASSAQYPATTTVTVLSDGCGQDWRWQPLSDRYEDLVVCRSPNGSLELQSRFDLVEFYRDPDRRNFSCTAGSVFLPADPRSGEVFSGSCTNGGNANSGGLRIDYSGQVAGDDVLDVGGAKVRTVHLVGDEQMSGDTTGQGTESLWLDTATGLIVKETRTETTRSESAVGWVPSSESFSIDLLSLTPKT